MEEEEGVKCSFIDGMLRGIIYNSTFVFSSSYTLGDHTDKELYYNSKVVSSIPRQYLSVFFSSENFVET